jgi:hypothetical protein
MQIPRSLLFLAAPLLLAGVAGCPGNPQTTADAGTSTTTTTSAPTASTAPTTSASAPPGSSDSGATDDSGATADAAVAAADAAAPKDAGTTLACGTKPLPDCPMQAWMKANTSAAMQAKNFPALAAALDQVVKMQPPGYGGWSGIAADGAKAARAQDIDAVKASCKSCHGQFQKRYQADVNLRPRKI